MKKKQIIANFAEWMKEATNPELKDFLDFCAKARTYPSNESLSNYKLENAKYQKIRDIAAYLADTVSKTDIYDLFINLTNLIEEFKKLDDSGDCGFDVINEKVRKAIHFVEDMETKALTKETR